MSTEPKDARSRVAAARRHREAGRPSVSPLLWAGVAAWLGSRAGIEAALLEWAGATPFGAALGWAAAAAGFTLALVLRRRPASVLVALVFAAGATCGLSSASLRAGRAAALASAPPGPRLATVIGDAREGTFGTTVDIHLAGAGVAAVMKVPAGSDSPGYGTRIRLWTRLRSVEPTSNSAADAFRSGTLLRASPWKIEDAGWAAAPLGPVARFRGYCLAALRAGAGANAEILSAMLFATQVRGEARSVLLDARTAGVAWAVSASGLHLAALLLLADRAVAFTGGSRRRRALAAVVVATAMVLACGLKPSLVRAAVAGAGVMASRWAGRRRDATGTLGGTVALMVLLDPTASYDVGLMLGVTAVTSIAVFGALARQWLQGLVGRRASMALGASACAQIAVGPLSAALFGGVSLLGPVMLVISGPLAASAATLALCGCLLRGVSGPAANGLIALAGVLTSAAAALWHVAARIPNAFVPTGTVPGWLFIMWAAGAALLWWRWPTPRRKARVRMGAAGLLAVFGLAWVLQPVVSTGVVALDVGQGDAILIRDGGRAVLIDTGPDPVALRRALARAHVTRIDGLVLTHAHDDHTGGLEGMSGVLRPQWVGVPDVEDEAVERLAHDSLRYSPRVVRLRRDMTFEVGETHVRVLWPTGGERLLDANDTSVILLAQRRGKTVMLLGDAEDRAQSGAMDAWGAPVDVLKVAHHGSPNGNVVAAIDLWRPSIAIISVGAGNRFGHPSRTALDFFASIGAVVHRTDLAGDVAYGWGGIGRVSVKPRPPSAATFLCDNPSRTPPHPSSNWNARLWPPISAISNPSTSYTARRSCSCSVPRSGFATGWRQSPTSISTWTPSTGIPPPPTSSSTPPTHCPS